MKRTIRIILLFGLLFNLTQQAESQQKKRQIRSTETKTFTAEQIAKKFLPSIVLIVCDDGKGNYSQGSGFFIRQGIILTNHHVIEGMVRGKAQTVSENNQSQQWFVDKILYTDSKNDLALLSINETDGKKTPVLNLSAMDKTNIGEAIYVLSNPKGLSGTISQGIISGGIRKTKDVELLQIDAPISPGSSGGAVLNSRGEVVGIATASLTSGQNLNFAVPSSQIKDFLDKYRKSKSQQVFRSKNELNNSWSESEPHIAGLDTGGNSGSGTRETIIQPKVEKNPTFEETTNWLTEKLESFSYIDRSGYYEQPRYGEIEGYIKFYFKNVKISKCTINYQFVTEFFSNDNSFNKIRFWEESQVNLKYLIRIDIKDNPSEVVLLLSQDANRMSFSSSKEISYLNIASLLFLRDKETAKRVANAFERLKEICADDSSEPF